MKNVFLFHIRAIPITQLRNSCNVVTRSRGWRGDKRTDEGQLGGSGSTVFSKMSATFEGAHTVTLSGLGLCSLQLTGNHAAT